MEHRYNYFDQNPNALVNGLSTSNRSSADGTQLTNNYSGSISSASPQNQSQFYEGKHTVPNAVPLMNNHLYQMNYSNQPPLSSGPPRTNAKGIYESPSISNAISLAQSNAENYPINPDFQLQPHLTGLLPQQSKRVPELYPVDNSINRGSIAANMNTNYFASNKSYPEPKIIEYDLEETSTESSPQHTSSLYSESTDQDSECTHPSNIFPRNMSNKSTVYHVTKESKTITSLNQEFPVPSQFADLDLNRDNIDDQQHSILHNAYNQDDDDIIEDIPLSDNINQNETESRLENQQNPESQFNTQSFDISRTQTFDYYTNKKDFGQTEFKYENKQSSSPSISNNTTNYLPYNVTNSSNIQNPQFNRESYFNQPNMSNSLNSSISQPTQSKPLFPNSNTELFNHQQNISNIQHYNDRTLSGNNTQQNKHVQSDIKNSNVPPIDTKFESGYINSKYKSIQDNINLNQSTSQVQTLKDQSQSINSRSTYDPPNLQTTESISQNSMYSSKTPVSEFLNDNQPITSQQFTAFNSLMTSTHSVGPLTSAKTTSTLKSLSSAPDTIVQKNQNAPHQTNHLFNLSNVDSSNNLINQESTNTVKSEFDNILSEPPNNSFVKNQQETTVDQSKSIDKQSIESQQENVKSHSQLNPAFQPKLFPNVYQPSINQFTSQQSTPDDNTNMSNDQLNNSTNCHFFDKLEISSQSVFNQQLPNVQSYSNEQNVHSQDIKPIIVSSRPSEISNNFMPFSNSSTSSTKLLSSNQQSFDKKFEITEDLKLESNILDETAFDSTVSSHSEEPVPIQSNNLNVESLEKSTQNMTLNVHESGNVIPNEHVDNQQNKLVSQAFDKQEQKSSASYFSKKTFDKEENSSVFQNNSSTVDDVNNLTPESSEINNTPPSVTNVKSLNPDQSISEFKSDKIPQLPIDNETILDGKPTVKPAINLFPSQNVSNNMKSSEISSFPPTSSHYPTQFSNQSTSNVISSASNQLPTQMFSNQLKSNIVPHLRTTSSSNPIQLFNNNKTTISNVLPTSLTTDQFPLEMFSNQPKSDAVPPIQSFNQMLSNQQKINTIPPFQSTQSVYPTQSLINQSVQSTVLPVSSESNQFPPQTFNNEPKLGVMPPSSTITNQSTSFNNESTSHNTVPVLSTINQFPPKMVNDQVKSEIMPSQQPTESGYPIQSFNNQSIQNTNPLVPNQLPSQIFATSPKPGILPPLQSATNQYSSQSLSNQPTLNTIPSVSSTASQLPPQIFSNQSKFDVSSLQTSSQYPSQPFNNQPISNTVPLVSSSVNQLPPILSNQSNSTVVPPIQSITNQYPPQLPNNQSRSNIPPVQLPPQMVNYEPRFNTGLSNKITSSRRYPSQPLNNQPMSSIPPTQQATNQYPLQPFGNQSKPNSFPPSQANMNAYPSQPFSTQPGQQFLSKSNHQLPPNNQFYNQTNSAQPDHNQWPPQPTASQQSTTPFSNQTNPMFSSQQKPTNLSSNLNSIPPSINQQTQRVGSQNLPPNPLSSNNYYNQVNNRNVQQSQPPTMLPNQNVQLGSKGYSQQSNMGISNQINYQQPNTLHGQQGFHNQQQDLYRLEQNPSVVQQGFAKTWGHDNLDLLKSRDVLPGDGVQPPEIKLPQGYANCDNCSPEIFRCTLNKFPSSKNLLDKSRLPLGILIHPYKDLSRLTIIQCDTITRCRNCRSYINPFVQFIDNAHWKCNLCYRVNELPAEFQIDPYTKTLGDPSRRPEIQNATIEYIASQDYMVRPPQPALYLFLLDVSRTATLTGYLEIVCDRILNKIMTDDIPGDSRTNIGFITYDSAVHFYQIANSDGGQPKQLIVSDISDIFLPLPDGLMVNLEENKSAVKDLLTSLPSHYKESYNTGCALGAALQAAFKILAPRGGRVTVFQACLPNCGPGSLESRDNGSTQTGDRVQHMTPSTDYYKKLALECSAEQIAVDMFFISSQYLDIATISGISKYSAGCIYNFPQFDVKSPTLVTRFKNSFDRYLSRKIGFEALLRLRCTRGVAIHSFHGNFFVRSSDLLMLPNVNPDNAYGMQLSIEDSLDGVSVVCFQAALLYTSSNAERRIRVHTLCIPVTDNLNDVFHNADQQAITCLIAKMAVDRSTEKSLSDAREAFFNAISDSLSAFKGGCSSYSGPGTMLSPISLKVFPLYILATLKHMAFRTNQPTRLDERMFSMCQMKSLPLISLIQYIYPNLYPIHGIEEQPKTQYEKLTEVPLPPVIQLSAERIDSNGIYLMDDGETLTIFIGHRCSDTLIQKFFGYVNVSSMPELITTIAEVDSTASYLLRSFISYLQKIKPYPLPIEIIKENGPHKLRFYSRLIEDKFESSLSYYEFLQRLSQQVR